MWCGRVMRLMFVFFMFMPLFASASIKWYKWNEDKISIELKDYLNISEMKWPVTLLRYKVDIANARVSDPKSFELIDETGKSISYQLTDLEMDKGLISKATLCFLSDLPSGATRKFQLVLRGDKPLSSNSSHLKIRSSAFSDVVLNGQVRLEINKKLSSDDRAIIVKLGNNTKWLGNLLLPERENLTDYQVMKTIDGDVFWEYHFRFCFEGSKKYDLKLRLIDGMDYVEMDESMVGFNTNDQLSLILDWNNFKPEIRYCPTRASQINKKGKGYTNYQWEPIEGLLLEKDGVSHPKTNVDQRNKEDGILPFRLSSYHNWMTWWRLHTAAFWSEKTDQSVGIYINDFEKWKDPSYPLWGSKEYLSVEYYYKNGQFYWKYPLVEGTRSTSIALYAHQKDRELVDQTNKPLVYIDYLRRWYGWISLNKTKDWILDYDSDYSMHQPFYQKLNQHHLKPDPKGVLERLKRNVKEMATAGERSFGPTPVGAREYLETLTPLLEVSESQFSKVDYKQARAYYLFMNYVFMDEALMPMRTMLSGHPNFLGDLKAIAGTVAFLYPDHPEAKLFADHFDKSMELNMRYHIRPDVDTWNAKGGRSTENLSCYTWAFLRPTLKTSFLLHHYYDGKNRMLHPNASAYGNWLLNTLTSPLLELGGRRAVPPQGAHSRKPNIPDLLNTFGQELKYYDPLLAEHIFWETHPDDMRFESRKEADYWAIASKNERPYEKGTNPRLHSDKFTGYGFVLRKNYGEKDEMYVNLQQIDDGPNYRWGRAGKGGNGIIYYYANGKRYSHNGTEDVGDGPFGDVERATNFGVRKEGIYRGLGNYRSVGRNDLTEPLFDFGFAQFASILANEEVRSHYNSRSVLMADNDYIVVFDDVASSEVEGCFSWFVGVNDEFPFIKQLAPGCKGTKVDVVHSSSPYHKDKSTPETKGMKFEGKGDFLTFVSHRLDLNVQYNDSVCLVNHPGGQKDWVFRSGSPILYNKNGVKFDGTSGFIRKKSKEHYQAALFNGKQISVPGITIMLDDKYYNNGVSLEVVDNKYRGKIQLIQPVLLKMVLDEELDASYVFYLNGLQAYPQKIGDRTYLFALDAGNYDWLLTDEGAIPGTTRITKSISGDSWCELYWEKISGATSYQVWLSSDYGKTWALYKKNITSTDCKIINQKQNSKIHVRVVAEAQGGIGEASGDYPIYFSKEKAHAPEGLRLTLVKGVLEVTWGQVLGADQYALYCRKRGADHFDCVYRGSTRRCRMEFPDREIYEFCVTAKNGNKESDKSIILNTDPDCFLNWDPVPGDKFKRDPESQENGYIEYNPFIEEKMKILTYPE